MKRGHRVSALVICGAVFAGTCAAKPPSPPAHANSAVSTPATPDSSRRPLDLRVGDIRKYMTPEEYRSLLTGRDEDSNTVVVQADVPLLPAKSERPIPSGMPLLPLWWAVTHPAQSWRILVPDLKAPPPGPPEKVPPPVFRWGP